MKQSHAQHIQEELSRSQAQCSKLEATLFEHQGEIKRQRGTIAEQREAAIAMEQREQEMRESKVLLQAELEHLQSNKSGEVAEAIMRDVQNWMSELLSYNQNYLDNQELLIELGLAVDDNEHYANIGQDDEDGGAGSLAMAAVNMDHVAKLVHKASERAELFEPTRKRIKVNMRLIEKSIQEYRALL